MYYRKKPVVIEAIKWNAIGAENNLEEIKMFVGEKNMRAELNDCAWEVGAAPPCFMLHIKTLEGEMMALHGDFIIKGIKGEFYPCKPDVFEQTYEPAGGSLA